MATATAPADGLSRRGWRRHVGPPVALRRSALHRPPPRRRALYGPCKPASAAVSRASFPSTPAIRTIGGGFAPMADSMVGGRVVRVGPRPAARTAKEKLGPFAHDPPWRKCPAKVVARSLSAPSQMIEWGGKVISQPASRPNGRFGSGASNRGPRWRGRSTSITGCGPGQSGTPGPGSSEGTGLFGGQGLFFATSNIFLSGVSIRRGPARATRSRRAIVRRSRSRRR